MKKYFTLFYVISLIIFLSTLTFCSDDDENPVFIETEDTLSVEGYSLLWNDEFGGNIIDVNKWVHEVNGYGGGNNELQYYTDRKENSFVQNGLLYIVGRQEQFTGSDGTRYYTSARLTTQQSKSFKYGKILARIKLPFGQGIWPAFWMLGINIDQIGWPACGEIDIMEMIGGDGGDNITHGTLHWDNNGHQFKGGSKKLTSGIFADDFHEFAIEWSDESVDWYLDGEKYFTLDITSDSMSEFHDHYFIILNLAIGGNWPGNPTTETVFPQEMIVDYVRVYQKN
jgi:beta-glucanase (GH16 family)